MEYLKVLGLSSFSVLVLFILTKLIGNKQMSQLNMFDYVVGITIGSIAAEMATALETNFVQPLIAMAVYTAITIIISYISRKSLVARRFIDGKSIILLNNGKLYKGNFEKAKIDMAEFLTECRNQGFFSVADINTAIIESNGKISILPNSLKRPATPEDLNIQPTQEKAFSTVILDGEILYDNLEHINKNKNWLLKELKKQGYKNEKPIFFAMINDKSELTAYTKIDLRSKRDKFL